MCLCVYECVCVCVYVCVYVCIVYVCIYKYIYVYIIYIYIIATNFTGVLLQQLVPSVYVLLYFGLLVYHNCMFHSM